jgi:hypothetical protein
MFDTELSFPLLANTQVLGYLFYLVLGSCACPLSACLLGLDIAQIVVVS